MVLRRVTYAVVLGLLPLLVGAGTVVAGHAPATTLTTSGVVTDPPHDSMTGPMDVSRVRFVNGAHRLTVVVHLNRTEVRDDLVMYLRSPQHRVRFGILSILRAHGQTRSRAVSLDTPHRSCQGLVVDWKATAVGIHVPSRCLARGHYGSLRFNLLTEDGSDSDYVPDDTSDSGDLGTFSRLFARAAR